MKKYFIFFISIYLYSTTLIIAQSNNLKDVSNDSTITNKVKIENVDNVVYRLYPTTNMWTFIKLNTRNGKMWQAQYSIEGNRFETYLNGFSLIAKDSEENGRFTLYPTQNMFNFILLDQIDGKLWQVQWNQEAEKRGIWTIN
jgi:hypothetical protein